MHPPRTIAIIGTLDTKAQELGFLRSVVEARGHRALMVDLSVRGEHGGADISRQEVAARAGGGVDELIAAGDRGAALDRVSSGAVALVKDLLAQGRIDGAVAIGGGSGSAVTSAPLRALPFGFPKVLVSTKGAGDVSAFVGTRDIAVLFSVTDVMGLNPILRRVLRNAANAVCGMVEGGADEVRQADGAVVAITAFGVTTPAAERCRRLLLESGCQVMVFHASGTGGRAMEELIEAGEIDAVLDLTTTELADELCGGALSAGPARLEAAGRRGIPQVVVPGALDMVNFGPVATIPPALRDRRLHRHNAGTTLMRTTRDENAELGRIVAGKLAGATGPTELVLPLGGISEYGRPDGPFHDPEADRAFFESVSAAYDGPIVRSPDHINDPPFAELVVARLLTLMASIRPAAVAG
ncbi:Tm-1-like ATP-binding domain-containing protein [Thalassobaculum sp.]|uniref:Tm-1-like ATP-binding domain-containing protein n=1 Tax=Thalassobaculum sp. TaxID=2022740 RepID=UPI0032F011F1